MHISYCIKYSIPPLYCTYRLKEERLKRSRWPLYSETWLDNYEPIILSPGWDGDLAPPGRLERSLDKSHAQVPVLDLFCRETSFLIGSSWLAVHPPSLVFRDQQRARASWQKICSSFDLIFSRSLWRCYSNPFPEDNHWTWSNTRLFFFYFGSKIRRLKKPKIKLKK